MEARNPCTDDEMLLLADLEALDGAQSILDFIPLLTPSYAAPVHLLPLVETLHRTVSEGGVRAAFSVPPRHGKTETLLNFVAWHLQRFPEKLIVYATYAAQLAQTKSKRAREIALRNGLELREDARSAHHWQTPEGGGLFATSIGGQLTGSGSDILIVDDPFKNREEAESPLRRQGIYDWFTSTATTRLEPGASVIVNHARWHDDDLIGRLAAETDVNWHVMNFPALDERGGALWPERWSAEALDMKRREVGPYDWASLYMGQPRPRGGRLFEGEPARFSTVDLEGARIAIVCDPAATEKNSADFSAIGVLGAKGHGLNQETFVLEMERDHYTVPRLVRRLIEVQKRWGAPIFVEAVGGFKAVPQSLRSINPKLRIVELGASGSKLTRALPAAAAWVDGRLKVPMEAEWLNAFLDEVQRFTGIADKRDDQVDVLAHGYNVVTTLAPSLPRGAQATGGGMFA